MSDANQNYATPSDLEPKIPSGINVLTILTFIGCGLGFIFSLWGYFGAKSNLDKMEEMVNSNKLDAMPAFIKKMYSPEAIELARKQYENRMPLTLLSLLAIILCLLGAIQMRQLKMQGYYLYVIGEVLPVLSLIIFVGTGAITGITGIFVIIFTLLFVLLYTAQRKHLVK